MVRLTNRELAFTAACITFSFCASLVSAAVSPRLGKACGAPCYNRAAPKPISLAPHWRVSCSVESQNLNLIPRAFWPFPRPPKGPGKEVDGTSELAARSIHRTTSAAGQLLDLVERFVANVGPSPIRFLCASVPVWVLAV